jgi:mannose-6-phosphate isomerase-like protein (cupin superfamily)
MAIITRYGDCPPFITKDGSGVRELMAYRNSACERMSLAEARIPPGGKTECHAHPEVEEIYYFLRGTGRVLAGDEYYEVGPGVSLVHRPGVRHQTWNTGGEPLVFLCHCAPAYEHEDTVILPDAGEPPGE